MRLLLDACAFLWLAGQPAKLSAPVVAAINDSRNELFLSDTSIGEIVLKHTAGKLPLPEPPRTRIPKQTAFFQLEPVRITLEALFRSGELPPVHADPFDRLLAAQAMVGGFHFVSPPTHGSARWERIVSGDVRRTCEACYKFAAHSRQETTMTLKWSMERLQMGAWTHWDKRLYGPPQKAGEMKVE